jgi:hypothetical protein
MLFSVGLIHRVVNRELFSLSFFAPILELGLTIGAVLLFTNAGELGSDASCSNIFNRSFWRAPYKDMKLDEQFAAVQHGQRWIRQVPAGLIERRPDEAALLESLDCPRLVGHP